MLNPIVLEQLHKIKDTINENYGFVEDIPRINYGPCGVFAHVFYLTWNACLTPPVHICFVLTKDREECDHVCLCLPSGDLYDGGIGIHQRELYTPSFLVEDMLEYDEPTLEKWSYGLDRTYPRYCPSFDRTFVEQVVRQHLEPLQGIPILSEKIVGQ